MPERADTLEVIGLIMFAPLLYSMILTSPIYQPEILLILSRNKRTSPGLLNRFVPAML